MESSSMARPVREVLMSMLASQLMLSYTPPFAARSDRAEEAHVKRALPCPRDFDLRSKHSASMCIFLLPSLSIGGSVCVV